MQLSFGYNQLLAPHVFEKKTHLREDRTHTQYCVTRPSPTWAYTAIGISLLLYILLVVRDVVFRLMYCTSTIYASAQLNTSTVRLLL